MDDLHEVERGLSFLDGLAVPDDDDLEEWPEVEPLPADACDVASFSPELLPESLRPWVSDIADRLQCPPDFVGIPAVVSLGAVLGRKVVIRPQARTAWSVVPNVWGCIVGRPGSMKSPAVSEAMRPLRRLAAQAREVFESEHAAWEGENELSKLASTAAKQKATADLKKGRQVSADALRVDVTEEPVLRRYSASDTSLEALGELLRQNSNGLLIERDEIASLLTHLGQEENAGARGFYLSGADGKEGYTFDRIGRGLNLHVPAVCLSLLGTTQPGRLGAFLHDALRGGAADDGLMQRFGLLVWPEQHGEWRNVDRWPDSAARNKAFASFEHCDRLTPDTVDAEEDDGERFLRFTPQALEVFTEWRIELETLLRGDLHPALESHFAKYRKTIPALALIFHLADGGTGPVGEVSTLRALAWFDYLASHARRCYGSSRTTDATAARRILERIARGDLGDGFTGREIKRKEWSGLTDSAAVDRALTLLCDHGFLVERLTDHERGRGRNTVAYRVNPKGARHGVS